jgi:hypothetical protein
MNLAQALYEHGQDLLALSWDCRDQEAGAAMRKIAHALLDLAYAQDEVVEVPRAAAYG